MIFTYIVISVYLFNSQHNQTGQLELSAQNANDELTNFQAEIADINTNVTAIHQRTTQIWSDYNTTLVRFNTLNDILRSRYCLF